MPASLGAHGHRQKTAAGGLPNAGVQRLATLLEGASQNTKAEGHHYYNADDKENSKKCQPLHGDAYSWKEVEALPKSLPTSTPLLEITREGSKP